MFTLLLFLSLIATIVWLHSSLSSLRARVEHMERYLKEFTAQKSGEGNLNQKETSHITANTSQETQALEEQIRMIENAVAPIPKVQQGGFIAWVKEDWLMKLGGFLVILGMGWFLSYAIAQGWIGEIGRIAIGFTVGAGVLLLGRYRMNTHESQGATLMFVGALTIVLTVWVARELYEFFTPASALVIMFLASAVLGATSVVFSRIQLAYANTALAALAPVLTNSPTPSLVGLFSYLFVLTLGAVWVATVTGWRQLILACLGIVFLYSFPFLTQYAHGEVNTGLMFAFVFTALFFSVSVFSMHTNRVTRFYDVATGLGLGTFLFWWIMVGAEPDWQSALLVIWAMVFSVGAFQAVRVYKKFDFFYIYAGVAGLFLGTATALEFEGPTLAIMALIETALVLTLGYRVVGKVSHIPALSLPLVIPILFSLTAFASWQWGKKGVLHEDTLVLFLTLFVWVLVGLFFKDSAKKLDGEDKKILTSTAYTFWGMAGVYSLALIWLITHGVMRWDVAGTIFALIFFTLIASAFYMNGKSSGKLWQRTTAGLLIGFVVLRLGFFEFWLMDTGAKVVTFLVIGALFMAVAWLERSQVPAHHNTSNTA